MEDSRSTNGKPVTSNGRMKRSAEYWSQKREQAGRRTSGRLVSQAKTQKTQQENGKVQLQIRQGNKPTVLHIVKTKPQQGAKRVPNNQTGKNNHKRSIVQSQSEKQAKDNVSVTEPMTTSPIKTNFQLLISNLALDVTKEQLQEHFRKTGGVKSILIPKEKGQDTGKGIAYIDFKSRISHGIALRLHHTTLAGKQINVEFSPNVFKNGKVKKTKK